mmetsp:Transcript_13564/g.23081  ORF Transcript_13564/g.23081 Transcript_13564/m.23081 type:complete len:132 (+) Transcript_13564:557-952(+)
MEGPNSFLDDHNKEENVVSGSKAESNDSQAQTQAFTNDDRSQVKREGNQNLQASPALQGNGLNHRKKKIVVLGSLNFDVFLKMKRMPEVGETYSADEDIFKAFGGKGANQAIAAARLNRKAEAEDDGEYTV